MVGMHMQSAPISFPCIQFRCSLSWTITAKDMACDLTSRIGTRLLDHHGSKRTYLIEGWTRFPVLRLRFACDKTSVPSKLASEDRSVLMLAVLDAGSSGCSVLNVSSKLWTPKVLSSSCVSLATSVGFAELRDDFLPLRTPASISRSVFKKKVVGTELPGRAGGDGSFANLFAAADLESRSSLGCIAVIVVWAA